MPHAKRLSRWLHHRLPSRDRRESKGPSSEQLVHESQGTSSLSVSDRQTTAQPTSIRPTSSQSNKPIGRTKELSVQPEASRADVEGPSLWALAYDRLRQENPVLVEDFDNNLGVDDTGRNHGHCPGIEKAAEKAVLEIQAVEMQRVQSKTTQRVDRFSQRAIKIIVASKDLIGLAASSNLYSALAWSAVSLLLPVSLLHRL